MWVGAYTPVIVFALLLVIPDIAHIRQHQWRPPSHDAEPYP